MRSAGLQGINHPIESKNWITVFYGWKNCQLAGIVKLLAGLTYLGVQGYFKFMTRNSNWFVNLSNQNDSCWNLWALKCHNLGLLQRTCLFNRNSKRNFLFLSDTCLHFFFKYSWFRIMPKALLLNSSIYKCLIRRVHKRKQDSSFGLIGILCSWR